MASLLPIPGSIAAPSGRKIDAGTGRSKGSAATAMIARVPTHPEAHPGRFLTFALVNFDGIDDADWGPREARRLEESFKAGAKGLKFHKTLGLNVRYRDGRLMPVDDPKLDPVWEACARHKRPVV